MFVRYLFDTVILSDDTIEIIDLYLEHIRPRLNPQCDFLLLSTNGTQFQSLTTAMTMLVHQAIGKHINPTRYRQIIETESSERLNIEEQHYISEDQKHSSTVAKIFYKKKQSRVVAIEGRKCMEKMTKDARTDANENLMTMFNNTVSAFDTAVLKKSQDIIGKEQPSFSGMNSFNFQIETDSEVEKCPYQPSSELNESTDLTITQTKPGEAGLSISTNNCLTKPFNIPNNDIAIKKEVAQQQSDKRPGKNVKFSSNEDFFLKEGIKKYGRKSWALILKDDKYIFHPSRTRDSLRVRADSANFKRFFNES